MVPPWSVRRIGFVAVAAVLSLLAVADFVSHLITDSVAPHRIHSIGHAAATGLMLLGVLPQLKWPQRSIAGIYLILAVGIGGIVGNLISGRFSPFPLVFLLFGVMLAALHPARAAIVRPSIRVHVLLLTLTVILAVPLMGYAMSQANLQRDDITSEHGAQGHWGLMASVPLMLILGGLVAATRMPGWRPAAAGNAVILAALGAGSLAFPDPSRFMTLWAAFGIVAGVAYAACALDLKRTVRVSPLR